MPVDRQTKAILAALMTLKRQFEAGASQYHRLNHLLIEAPRDQSQWFIGPFPVEGCRRPEQAIATSFPSAEISFRVQKTEAPPRGIWGAELQDVFDGMADQYVRLERLYLPRKAAGFTEDNDADTKLIREHLGRISMACQILDAMVRGDALVARSALKSFYEFSAEADRVLEAHLADAARHSEAVH